MLKDSEAKAGRERILRAAETLFAERGFSAVSIRDIAQVTGMSHGALYHHFESKEDLFCQVIDAGATRFLEQLQRAAGDSQSGTTRERLRRLFAAHSKYGMTDGALSQLMRDVKQVDYPPLQEVMQSIKGDFVGVYEGVLQDGMLRGEVSPLPIHLLAIAIIGLVSSMFNRQWISVEATPEERLELLMAVVFDGIGENTLEIVGG